MAAAKEISVDAAVLSQLDGIFTIKEEQKKGTEAVSQGTTCFHFTDNWLWQSDVKHSDV